MKYMSLFALIAAVALVGCGKKESTDAATPSAAAETAAAVEQAAPAAEAPAEKSTMDSLAEAGSTAAAKVAESTRAATSSLMQGFDASKLSWDSLGSVPYENKDELVKWIGGQVDTWKDKLAKAATDGSLADGAKNLLGSLGGGEGAEWQKALEGVTTKLTALKESNPETYAMARDALVGAWKTFEIQAKKFLGQG